MRRKPEKTQPGNPHGLTLKQHILPARSIERFADSDGRVSVIFKNKPNPQEPVSPNNPLFCAKRIWDHGSEISCKTSIEDPFQELAERIISGETTSINEEDKAVVDSFYGLWESRAYFNANPPADILINATGVEYILSIDEQELSEKNNVTYVTPELKIKGRDLTGEWISIRIINWRYKLNGINWSIVRTSAGEFFVPNAPPNAPKFHYVPISPIVSLIAEYPQGFIGMEEVCRINGLLYKLTDSYIFARDFSRCCIAYSEISD